MLKGNLTWVHYLVLFFIASVLCVSYVMLNWAFHTEEGDATDDPAQGEDDNNAPARYRRVISLASNFNLSNHQANSTTSSTCGLGSVRQAVIIRMCGIIRPALRRHLEKYAMDLSKTPHLDLWILYDTDNGTSFNASWAEPLFEMQREYPKVGLFFYNWNPIKHMLPYAYALNQLFSANWWFHDASLMLWARHCGLFPEQPFSETRDFFIWTIEADSFFVGDVSTFFDFYANNTADYIGDWRYTPKEWMHRSEFSWQAPKRMILDKHEFVERYSMRLLRFLYAAVKMNVVSWGEAFATTVCHLQEDWCTIDAIHDQHVGLIWRWDLSVDDEELARLQQDPTQQGKWNHAASAYKGFGCIHSISAPTPALT